MLVATEHLLYQIIQKLFLKFTPRVYDKWSGSYDVTDNNKMGTLTELIKVQTTTKGLARGRITDLKRVLTSCPKFVSVLS